MSLRRSMSMQMVARYTSKMVALFERNSSLLLMEQIHPFGQNLALQRVKRVTHKALWSLTGLVHTHTLRRRFNGFCRVAILWRCYLYLANKCQWCGQPHLSTL